MPPTSLCSTVQETWITHLHCVTSLQNPSGIFGTVCLSTTWNLWKERKKKCSEESEPHGIAATENSNGDAAAEQILSMTIGKHSPHCRRNVAVQFTAMLAILFTLQFNCNLNTESLSTEIITELTKQLPATSKKKYGLHRSNHVIYGHKLC
jgi:hypothetical protein